MMPEATESHRMPQRAMPAFAAALTAPISKDAQIGAHAATLCRRRGARTDTAAIGRPYPPSLSARR